MYNLQNSGTLRLLDRFSLVHYKFWKWRPALFVMNETGKLYTRKGNLQLHSSLVWNDTMLSTKLQQYWSLASGKQRGWNISFTCMLLIIVAHNDSGFSSTRWNRYFFKNKVSGYHIKQMMTLLIRQIYQLHWIVFLFWTRAQLAKVTSIHRPVIRPCSNSWVSTSQVSSLHKIIICDQSRVWAESFTPGKSQKKAWLPAILRTDWFEFTCTL